MLFFSHEEGRVRLAGTALIYETFLKDHLGNVRVMFADADGDGWVDPADTDEVLQLDHFYPFGLRMAGLSTAPGVPNFYTFTGKEYQDELGLGWVDFGARMYDASVGRWNGVDALAEAYLAWSPFNYTLGNPIRLVDPDGRSVSIATMIQNAWDATPEDGAVKFTVNSSTNDSETDEAPPQGLTTHRLRQIAGSTSWGRGTSGVTLNRRAGRAFQNTALNALNLAPENGSRIPSKERRAFGHRSGLVQPDFIGPVVDTDTRGRVRSTYANSTFVEVKAVDGTLTLSSSSQQIRGLIDIAANSPAGKSGNVRPAVFFVTTSNTVVGADVIAEATAQNVNVFQITAFVNENNTIQFGPAIPLQGHPSIPLQPITAPAALSHYRNLDPTDPDQAIVQ